MAGMERAHASRRAVVLQAVGGALGTGLLAACAQGAGGGEAGQAGAATDKTPKTLVFNHRTGQPQAEIFQNHFNPAFQKLYPHITIEYASIPGGEWQDKFKVLYAAGTPGDLIWSNQADQMHFYSAAGMLKPLDDLAKRDRYDLNGFYPKTIADNRWNGKLFGLPWQSHAGLSGLYVNADLAQQYGVALPGAGKSWTLEEMEAAARKLADESAGRWGFYIDLPSGQLYQNFVYSHGATILNAEGTKHELNDPKLIAGLEWMADMIHRRRLAPKPAERQGTAWDNLAQKKVAMFLAGAWNIPQTEQAVKSAFKWTVLPPPTGPGGAITGDAANDNWSIPAPATAAEAAWLYMKWFCEDQQLIDWMRLWGGNPTARPKLNESHYGVGELAEYRKPHIAQLQSGKYRGAPTPKNQRQVDLKNRLLPPKLAEVWAGVKTVRQALQELDAPVTALLAEPLQGS